MKSAKMLTILVLRSELLRRVALVLALGLMVCQAKVSEAAPLGMAFTYQGRLIDANSAAEGLYDFQFKLFNDPNVILGTQVGDTIDINELDVIDGYFTAALDFGANVFTGDARWLEIGVRPGELSDPCEFTILEPRMELTPTPYAIYAATVPVPREAVYPFTRADIPAVAGDKKRDDCDDASLFTTDYCTAINDTDNFVCGGANKQSVKMTKTDTGFNWCAIKRDWGESFDVRDGTDPPYVRVRFYIHEGSGDSLWSRIHYLYFDVYAPDFSNRFKDGLVFGPSGTWPGWFEGIICPSHWATVGSPDWATVNAFRFRIVTYNNSEVPAATDELPSQALSISG